MLIDQDSCPEEMLAEDLSVWLKEKHMHNMTIHDAFGNGNHLLIQHRVPTLIQYLCSHNINNLQEIGKGM